MVQWSKVGCDWIQVESTINKTRLLTDLDIELSCLRPQSLDLRRPESLFRPQCQRLTLKVIDPALGSLPLADER